MERYELYERFRALHVRKQGFVMPNAWDGVSALLIKKSRVPGHGNVGSGVLILAWRS